LDRDGDARILLEGSDFKLRLTVSVADRVTGVVQFDP
jgi:hypothetical protein